MYQYRTFCWLILLEPGFKLNFQDYFTINHTTGEIDASEKIDAEKETRFVLTTIVNDTGTREPCSGIKEGNYVC
jgi:hypothetical protein